MIYTPEEYKKVYFRNASNRTVRRRIQKGYINSKHTIYHIGRFWLIEVPTDYKIKLSK